MKVCGLKWGMNPTSLLASGGNDNKLLLWEQRMNVERDTITQPYHQYTSHKAAVKAIAWYTLLAYSIMLFYCSYIQVVTSKRTISQWRRNC
jgi:hypothetical protein